MHRAVLLVPVLSCLFFAACIGGDASPDVLPTRADSDGVPATTPLTGDQSGAADRLARAPAATEASGTARTTTVATVTGLPGRTEPFTLRGEGAIDFVAGASRSILSVDNQASGRMAAGDTEFETVVVGGWIYVRAPALTSLAGASAAWVRIDPAATGSGEGSGPAAPGFGPLTGLAASGLGAPIAMLGGVDASSVREVDVEVKADEAITSLQATVDLLAASAEGATPDDLAALEVFLERLGARQLQVDVELDDDDRLRRLVYEHDVPTPGGPVRQRFDVTYFDFGAPVEIATPPDDHVRDLTDGRHGG